MKLLGWMNQKLRQNSIEPLKNFSIGNSCSCLSVQPSFDKQQYHLQPSKRSAHSKQTKTACPKYYSTGITGNKEEEVLKEKPSIMMSELFHGFLTIGTLGSEPITEEPTTPRFSIALENVNEKETEVTENELKLINEELEKFLEAEAKEVDNEPSGRSSYVSIVTLISNASNQIEDVEVEEHKNMVTCPLQGYLFSSLIECSETAEEKKKEKGSLGVGELFKKHSIDYEQYKGQSEKNGTQSKGTYAMHFMKKMLKKIHIPSRSCTASVNGHAADSLTNKRKLPKALRMLHRRIHPERSTADKKVTKSSHKYEKENFSHSGKHQGEDVTFLGNANKNCLHTTIMLKEEITSTSLSHNRLTSKSHSTGNGEHWIKTDADFYSLFLSICSLAK